MFFPSASHGLSLCFIVHGCSAKNDIAFWILIAVGMVSCSFEWLRTSDPALSEVLMAISFSLYLVHSVYRVKDLKTIETRKKYFIYNQKLYWID